MPDVTPRLKLPYLKPSDAPDLSGGLYSLATGVEGLFGFSDWTAFVTQNGYTGDPNSTYPIRFRRNAGNEVTLEGLINTPSNATAFQLIGTLPAGYRPQQGQVFTVAASNGPAQLQISTDGSVLWRTGTASTSFFTSGVRFYAA